MAYLEGNNLVASYGVVPILHECSVEVEKGELAVIVGPNGAGKSTVMRVLLDQQLQQVHLSQPLQSTHAKLALRHKTQLN
jgi:ABC-type Mn2+/Zn2+ transport system ATPase subunit